MKEIPVYLFTGFLEAGKTKVIQETLEDQAFNTGEQTLILCCEEGLEEYDISSFASPNATLSVIEDESQLTEENLLRLAKESKAERIMLEYNGMWTLDKLYNALPQCFLIYQELFLADSTTFKTYNANMRSLVVDKLQSCEMVVFNRCHANTDKMELHKIVRGVSRGTNIAYEMTDGKVEYDEIVDPLPFNINADIVTIEDRDFAIFYRDLCEEPQKYVGKTLTFKALVGREDRLGDRTFVAGRHIMVCCQDDIAYRGMVCIDTKKVSLKTGAWIQLTAHLQMEKHALYQGIGPVLHVIRYRESEQPQEVVATFY